MTDKREGLQIFKTLMRDRERKELESEKDTNIFMQLKHNTQLFAWLIILLIYLLNDIVN